jgi:ATP-binding cassette subfamily B protein
MADLMESKDSSPIAARAKTPRRGPGGPHRGGPGMMPGEKARDFKGSIIKLARFMSVYKVQFAIVVIFAIGSTIFSIVGPKVLSEATTALFEGIVAKVSNTGGIDYDLVARVLVTTLVLYLLSAA